MMVTGPPDIADDSARSRKPPAARNALSGLVQARNMRFAGFESEPRQWAVHGQGRYDPVLRTPHGYGHGHNALEVLLVGERVPLGTNLLELGFQVGRPRNRSRGPGRKLAASEQTRAQLRLDMRQQYLAPR